MNKLNSNELKKYKRILIGTLVFIFLSYITIRSYYNKALIDSGYEPINDFSFPAVMGAIFLVAVFLFKIIEKMNQD